MWGGAGPGAGGPVEEFAGARSLCRYQNTERGDGSDGGLAHHLYMHTDYM